MKRLAAIILIFAFMLISCGKSEVTPITATKKGIDEVITTEDQSSETEAETSPSATSMIESDNTENPSSEETSEETTGEAIEAFLCSVWQGNDSNVTTIEFFEDHTLYYRELYSNKIRTVMGRFGSWELLSVSEIRIVLPDIGNGYILKGLLEEESLLLQCENDQPWNDEIIHKTPLTHDDIILSAEQRFAKTLPDGTYTINLGPDCGVIVDNKGAVLFSHQGKETKIVGNYIETDMDIRYYDGIDFGTISLINKIRIPVSSAAQYEIGSFDPCYESYAQFFGEIYKQYAYWMEPAPLPLGFRIEKGELVVVFWAS